MQRYLSILFVGMLAIVGCGSEPEPVEVVEEAPPPPTPQEIAAKIIQETQLEGPLPAPGSSFPTAQANQLRGRIQTEKNRHSATPDGQTALRIVSRAIERRIAQFQTAELWEHLLAHVEVHGILNPNSTRYASQKERAVSELMKPQPTILGFLQDGRRNETMVMIQLYLPTTQETHKERMRVGEELYGLRLEEIIGSNQGVIMEYIKTGQTFEVLMGK